jgi:hypothetical protein
MGRPTTLLEGLCNHAVLFGAESIEVNYKDGREWVFANKGGTGIGIASYKSSSADRKELRQNLYAAAKKPVRSVIGSQVYNIKVSVFESFGEDAFAVSIDLAPNPDPSMAPSFTAKQGQHLSFIYNYTKIHGQPPAESDLERYFKVSPSAIHEMIKTLERNGLIERIPGRLDPFASAYNRRICRDCNRLCRFLFKIAISTGNLSDRERQTPRACVAATGGM